MRVFSYSLAPIRTRIHRETAFIRLTILDLMLTFSNCGLNAADKLEYRRFDHHQTVKVTLIF